MGKNKTTFKKGHEPLKKKGDINTVTRDIKTAYKNLIEMNLENMTIWLQKIADEDPAKAIHVISELSEYVIPKLARTEIKGDIGINRLNLELPPVDNADSK